MGLIIRNNVVTKYKEELGVTEVIIPEGVTEIAKEVFADCYKLKKIILPKSIKSIGKKAFCHCDLKDINIPEGVPEISETAFGYCYSLKKITLPESIKSIGKKAFFNCTSLKDIKISKGVTIIGEAAFCNCESLEIISIPDSVTTIGKEAFFGCTSLKKIKIPEGVATIGEEAFFYCTNLENISIPDTVTSIGERAFLRCNIKNIDVSSYKVFLLLSYSLKIVACSSIVRNYLTGKVKYEEAEIKDLKNYIKAHKYDLIPYAVKNNELLNFMLNNVAKNLITSEEAYELMMKTPNTEVRMTLLNYINENRPINLNSLGESDSDDFDDELDNNKKIK